MNGFQRFLVERRILLLLAFAAAAGAGAWALRGFAVEAGTDVLLNQADPDLAFYNQVRADWETDEYVIVCCRRNEGWFTPDSLALLSDMVRATKAMTHAKKVLSIGQVPLLRTQPLMMGLPLPAKLMDEQGALNPKINVEKAKAERLAHTQALGNLISGDGKDLSMLVYLDVPEDVMRLEPEWNRLLGSDRTPETSRRIEEIRAPYQAAIQETNLRRNALVQALRGAAAAWRPKLDEPVRLSGLPIINVVLREHIKADIATFGIVSLS